MDLEQLKIGVAITLVGLFFMYLLRVVQNFLTSFDDDKEIVKEKNVALAFHRIGIHIAYALGLMGSISATSAMELSLVDEIVEFSVDAFVMLILLNVTYYINNYVFLRRVDNEKEIDNHNLAIGVFEFGTFIATGLLLFASFTGEGGGLLSAVVFYVIGQLSMIILFEIYELFTTFNIKNELHKKNVAAGVEVAGKAITIGVLLTGAIMGPFSGWQSDLIYFGWTLLFSCVFIVILNYLIDLIFLPKLTIKKAIVTQKNTAAILLVNGILISFAVVVSFIL